jgi:serine/threonine-protein kinase RsbW
LATVELEIPSRKAYVAVVRLALSSLARSAGLTEEGVDDLKIAISEACTNAVMSNEQAEQEAPVTITWTEERSGLVIEVGDRGRIFDPDAVDPSDTQGLRLVMSLALLRSLVDDCKFTPRDGGGMCTRISVHR